MAGSPQQWLRVELAISLFAYPDAFCPLLLSGYLIALSGSSAQLGIHSAYGALPPRAEWIVDCAVGALNATGRPLEPPRAVASLSLSEG